MARNHSFDKMSHRGAACPISVTPRGEACRADRGSLGGAEEEENPMRFAVYLRSLAMMLAGLVVLSACTVVVEDEGPRPGPRPDFCTREYQPVCGRRSGEERTFSNACLADRAGYRIVNRGECRRGGGGDGPRACTREYRPVCAERRGNQRTFANACEADVAGYRVVDRGECRRGGGGGGERVCTMEYRPVCAMRRGNFRTFGNACQADADGWRVVRNGPC
jgi:hypothetical protein